MCAGQSLECDGMDECDAMDACDAMDCGTPLATVSRGDVGQASTSHANWLDRSARRGRSWMLISGMRSRDVGTSVTWACCCTMAGRMVGTF